MCSGSFEDHCKSSHFDASFTSSFLAMIRVFYSHFHSIPNYHTDGLFSVIEIIAF